MSAQSFKNHSRFVPAYHYFASTAILALLVGSGINAFDACNKKEGFYSATLICLMTVVIAIVWLYARVFALKAQDRAIRAEENLRHFAMTGKLLDSRLRMGQVIALRFASDAEFVALANKAADQNMSAKDIKMAIQNWKEDNNRV